MPDNPAESARDDRSQTNGAAASSQSGRWKWRLLSERYCPSGRWWWPWHRWRFDGYLTGADEAGYKVLCKRCRQGRRVYA